MGTIILTKRQVRPASLCTTPSLSRSVSRFQGRSLPFPLAIGAGQSVEQQVVGGPEEVLPARLQMREELGAVSVDAIQTIVAAVLGGQGQVFVEQLVHGAGPKSATVEMPLAARSDPLAHGEQGETFGPGPLGLTVGHAWTPAGVQVQFVPKPATQPAIAEAPRLLEGQFGEPDLESVEPLGRDGAVCGEATNLLGALILRTAVQPRMNTNEHGNQELAENHRFIQ